MKYRIFDVFVGHTHGCETSCLSNMTGTIGLVKKDIVVICLIISKTWDEKLSVISMDVLR